MHPREIENEVAKIVKINAMAGHHLSDENIAEYTMLIKNDNNDSTYGDKVVAELKKLHGVG